MTIAKRSPIQRNPGTIREEYHLIREIVNRGDVKVSQIASDDNLAYLFTKGLTQKTFDRHVEGMGVRCIAA